MQAPIQKITNQAITPLKIGGERSVGPFVTVAKDDEKYYCLHVLFFLHSAVPEDTKIGIEEDIENNIITLVLGEGSGSDTESGSQNIWSILVPLTKGSKGESFSVIVDFNEELGEPKRGTKIILP